MRDSTPTVTAPTGRRPALTAPTPAGPTPGVMLDQFLALPEQGTWLYFHPLCCLKRQSYEDPHWQYPAAGNRDGYSYQSHQWQPVAWQDDRDLRQGESHGKSYRDQHYYRGYHPNLATGPPGHDRTYNFYEQSYTSTARREGTLSSDSGEAGGWSKEAILHGTEELEELQAFPGPLAREDLHKVDVMTFCQQKINRGCDLSTQRGRDSSLLWKLLVLLCRQNGDRYRRQEPAANLLGMADDEWAQRQPLDLITGELPPVVETQAQIVEKFTKLLYYGRKKEALVWAMRNQLWGHALFLSSKMDPRTYSWVLTGFTSTLATNDPLQTLFQLMSGRIPQAALCCGDATWGDWRPHLAAMLSNKVADTELNHRAIVTMGDTLASKGAVEAAHFCYLMADVPFGYFGAKADRMALLGSSHRAPTALSISLLPPLAALPPSPKVYKLLYASRLADHGLPAQALQYCELVASALLRRDPAAHPVLARQVVRVSLRLLHPNLAVIPAQELLGWEGLAALSSPLGFAAEYSKARASTGFLIPVDFG
ncbi:hypothetical protein EK904_003616 [Melospiza melodia maxima]|nr:hypothetical protein EK904_003616 [Melospiza melodia maxima]